MESGRLLPFERNRYYPGKLLTSADFQAEQAYGSRKRRFLNRMLFGSGIVCGLGVYGLDDLSFMVDSGVALDGLGREIAVERAAVRRLSAVEGFETLTSDRAALCLRYQEEAVHPVYAMRNQEDGDPYECNRIREGWSLFLQDMETLPRPDAPEPEFLTSAPLYAGRDYTVVCTMPARSPCGGSVRMDAAVRRLRETAEPLSLTAVIQTPAFMTGDGGHELTLELREVCPEETLTVSFWLTAQSGPAPETVLLADRQAVRVLVGGEEQAVGESFLLKTALTEADASELVEQAAASASLESREVSGAGDFVPLAEILFQRAKNACMIEEIRGEGLRRYIQTAASAGLRRELHAWFRPAAAPCPAAAAEAGPAALPERYAVPLYATGTCEIPLGNGARRGCTAFSEEIIHGLGPGTAYVSVGAEYLAEDARLGAAARSTVYGSANLFPREQAPVVPAETAVRVMNDRGSFIVAARLLEDSAQAVLPLRWTAVLMPGGQEENRLQSLAGRGIAAVQPTVVMAPRESHYFGVRFQNMEPCGLAYTLTERDSGGITSDGIYTAPGREGVFEIRISCAEMPLVCTYAYAVVKRRAGESSGGEDPGAEETQGAGARPPPAPRAPSGI